jgi:hypothetical protein
MKLLYFLLKPPVLANIFLGTVFKRYPSPLTVKDQISHPFRTSNECMKEKRSKGKMYVKIVPCTFAMESKLALQSEYSQRKH